MKLFCCPTMASLPPRSQTTLPVLLFGRDSSKELVSIGASVAAEIGRRGLVFDPSVWDLLSLALSVIAADSAVLKPKSPDGWTREIELTVGVSNPDFWATQIPLVEQMLRFLTTDIWQVSFIAAVHEHPIPKRPIAPTELAVALLSGGIDSLVGVLDLTAKGMKPFTVSQIVLGDAEKQTKFAAEIGGGLQHLQLNHNVHWAETNDQNQRARSFVFLAYGVLAAASLNAYRDGATIPLYVSENGLISINPPLTDARLGSLSTRTTHPVFIALVQQLLNNAGFRVRLVNPYQFKTKGEMLAECLDQSYLSMNAHQATSCGRYRRNGFKHCGRCVPCLIRRAAFHRWPRLDTTVYVYHDLSQNDSRHAGFDDVRSASMALAVVDELGVDAILGASLASPLIPDIAAFQNVALRGLMELGKFLKDAGVK